MAGRRFRRSLICGGLFAAALGCNRNNYHDNFGLPKPGQTVGAITPNGGALPGKSMWSSSTPAMGPGSMAAKPIEAAPPKRTGKGLSPDGEVSFADTHVAAA